LVEFNKQENRSIKMPAALREIQQFSRFVEKELCRGQNERSLEDYLRLWREELDRETTLQALQEGIEDVRSGRTRPAADVLAEIRRELGAPST
jgi:hypothetical protein